MERPLTVGQLAHATGVSAKTIRYYSSDNWRRCSTGSRRLHPRLTLTSADAWIATLRRNRSHSNTL